MDNTWNTLLKIGKIFVDLGFIILPNVGYMHQYLKIRRIKNSAGFSKLVSFILITSFIVRIFFWIGQRFEYAILFNAILGMLMQLFLLNGCIKYSPEYNNRNSSEYFSVKEFWNWPYFMDYFYFISFLVMFLSLISNIIGYSNKTYIFLLGMLTAGIEALLGIPQVVEIFKSRNVSTISYVLVLSWVSGDMFKLGYYVMNHTPMQLIVCVCMQLLVDGIVICQIVYFSKYGGNAEKARGFK